MVLARCAALKRLFQLLASLALCALPVRAQITSQCGNARSGNGDQPRYRGAPGRNGGK